jgi:type I restriction enzyme S subunit
LNELPEGWSLTGFMDVFDLQGGTQPPKSSFKYEPQPGYIQLLQIRDFGERSVPTYIPNLDTLKKCNEQDILIARYGASLGRILTGFSGAYNVAMAKVDIPDEIYNRFAYHLLRSEIFQAPLRSISRSAQSGFNKQDITKIEIPIPPFNEQKRIADKLDKLFTRIDACCDRLARIPQILEKFRQNVLNDAISGYLTDDWRSSQELADEWEIVKLSEVASSRLGKMLDKSKNQGVLTPYLRNLNVRWFYFDLTDIQKIRVTEDEVNNFSICYNDVLICEGGEPGRCAIWKGESNVYVYQKALHRVRVGARLLPEWLCYCLKNSADSGRLLDMFKGTTIAHLTGITLSQFQLILPSVEEQREIVNRIEKLFADADYIENYYKSIVTTIDQLTAKLLDKAFRGELVPQDPSDEPASVLLERIRTERLAQPPRPKRIPIRKSAMTKQPKESLKEIIKKLPKDQILFDDLREHFPGNYDLLKNTLFDILDETEPIIKQVFDREKELMCFIREQK